MVSHRNNVTVTLFVEPGDGELQDEVNVFLYSLVNSTQHQLVAIWFTLPTFSVNLEYWNLKGLLCNACVQRKVDCTLTLALTFTKN